MSFAKNIRPHVTAELQQAAAAARAGDPQLAFRHLERAHVLGQMSTREHVRAHWHMLRWAVARRSAREFLGQAVRMAGAAVLTPFGRVPAGNTGGSDLSPFRRLPIPADLARIIDSARSIR